MSPGPERHLIKKYANRKLYDTRTSQYVTLDGIADLVRAGHDIRVVDRDTGNDITQVVLSQIVLTEEKRGPQRLVDAGTDAIHERGQALLDYVRKTLNVPGDLGGIPDRDDGPRRRRESAADRDTARGLHDRHTGHDALIVHGQRLATSPGKVVQRVLKIERRQSGCVNHKHHARPVNRHQAFEDAQLVQLRLQRQVRGRASA